MTRKTALLTAAAWTMIAAAAPAVAQDVPGDIAQDEPAPDAPATQDASDIIVQAGITFRNRTEDTNPVLSYDLEYFQRFEPVSVGEMLKRVPGATFTSDVLEYDGVQLRGLPAGFTQVLINGRRAPGGEADGSFFVDRLPAELVERIEIVRAPRADQPSEGVAGTLNVITKEAASFEGGFAKLGALINAPDGKIRPSGAVAWAGRLGAATSLWAALNYQERRNPKQKVSYRFGGEPTFERPYETDPEFDDREDQADTRDGSDLSGNIELAHEFAGGARIRLSGLFVDTDRTETEISDTFEGEDLDYVEQVTQVEDINQQTYGVTADAVIPLGERLQLGLAGGWSGYREDSTAVETAINFEDDETEIDETLIDLKDDEYTGTAFLRFGEDTAVEVKAGIDVLKKKRSGLNNGDLIGDDFRFRIDEDRYDPYVRATWKPSAQFTVDAGVRYELTRRTTSAEDFGDVDYDTGFLAPSLHLRFAPSAADQFRASLARTTRRPDYDLISPYEQEESPGDDDTTIGNPALRNQRAWGVDIGYERRLAGNGIFGVNFFYRDISDLIELVVIGDAGDGQLFTPQNIGDGETWGVEVDASVPLSFVGLPDTGLFANYTYLDSSTRDPFTGEKRRFNNQPHHVYNLGFIQTLRDFGASFGATVSGRSAAFESNFDETIDLRYDPDLEAFVEKRFGDRFVLRFTVQNILDREKKEDFRKYDGDSLAEILENRAAGDLDEYEIERETSGQLFQVTLRAAF